MLIHGRSKVLHYLCNEGFRALGGVAKKEGGVKEGGATFAQPCELTREGDTRLLLCAGDRAACGSALERFRMGEQLSFDQWGRNRRRKWNLRPSNFRSGPPARRVTLPPCTGVTSILRVQQPLETHYEWASCFHTANFASIRRQIDDDATFYCIVHHVTHQDKQRKAGFAEVASRKTSTRKYTRGKDVFEQLELEMVRT